MQSSHVGAQRQPGITKEKNAFNGPKIFPLPSVQSADLIMFPQVWSGNTYNNQMNQMLPG